MKLRLVIRIAVVVSVIFLCAGFGVYSFFKLNAVENQREFNLYTLVPQNAIAVLETDRMAELVNDINQLNCSKDNHYLYVSELFVYLKKHLFTLVDNTPHGFSKQMNKMLISFHEPDTPLNQVLYCSFGSGDYELVESFIKKYCSSGFPSKFFDYKGEEIRIYPMPDGHFLAAYVTEDFLAVSFQKRLIEQVIDARHTKQSLIDMQTFRDMHINKKGGTTVYVRMKSVDMGKATDGIRSQARVGSWAEFDMKLNDNAIYLSGISHGSDTTRTFINTLRRQEPVEGFPGERLPSSTFFFDCWALSDMDAMFGFTSSQEYAKATYSDYIKMRDGEWLDFLKTHSGEKIVSCLFQSKDTLNARPCAVMSLPVRDVMQAEQRLQSLLFATPSEKDAPDKPQVQSNYKLYPKARGYRYYVLPRNTLMTQLTGITESALYTFACFYRGYLLLAPDTNSLSAYIDALERQEVMDGTLVYEEGIGSLSPLYNFVMMMDMEEILKQPETYVRLIPNFFFRQAKFFRHFTLAVQFTYADGVVYPNIVLLYNGDK